MMSEGPSGSYRSDEAIQKHSGRIASSSVQIEEKERSVEGDAITQVRGVFSEKSINSLAGSHVIFYGDSYFSVL